MKITAQEYKKLSERTAPKSPLLKDCMKAFFIGGVICSIGECIIQMLVNMGLELSDARAYCCMALIALSGVLTTFNIYDDIAKHAGAGTLVPITGFANAIVAPAIEYKQEGYITGVGSKIFTIAGPVIVYGVLASVIYGIFLMIKR